MTHAEPQAAPIPVRRRRTQEERSAETRERLIAATIECICELGYRDATTAVIAERAGRLAWRLAAPFRLARRSRHRGHRQRRDRAQFPLRCRGAGGNPARGAGRGHRRALLACLRQPSVPRRLEYLARRRRRQAAGAPPRRVARRAAGGDRRAPGTCSSPISGAAMPSCRRSAAPSWRRCAAMPSRGCSGRPTSGGTTAPCCAAWRSTRFAAPAEIVSKTRPRETEERQCLRAGSSSTRPGRRPAIRRCGPRSSFPARRSRRRSNVLPIRRFRRTGAARRSSCTLLDRRLGSALRPASTSPSTC